ncbi:MAG: hypothetical protein DMG39_16945 [Acidobacteria bacterium]|nr:MAG: hypothetical protein DMG39_16945 [Acidobacteriota bacterium]
MISQRRARRKAKSRSTVSTLQSYTYSASRKLETWKPQRLLVECQGVGTARSRAERCDDSIGERPPSILEGNHGAENFLLIFHNKHIGLKLDSRNDFIGC